MSIHLVSVDFETRSPVDLKAAGVHKYAAHPQTDVWCMAYCLTEDPADVKLWNFEEVMLPPDLAAAIEGGAYIRAWNAQFERVIWNTIMAPRYGWPELPTHRFLCAMAMAAAAALPLSLDKAAIALRLQQRKDMEGHRLMLKMSRPRKPRKKEAPPPRGTYYWHDTPAERQRLGSYCMDDVRTEMAVWKCLPPAMDARERKLWIMDQRINDRGIALDLPLIHAARGLIDAVQPELDAALDEITGGLKVTQVAKLKDWLAEQGIEVESLNKASVESLLADPDLDADVRTVLTTRQEGAKSSTAKYAAMLAAAGSDGRVRGTMQYFGATTGRWAGRGIQPHNNPTPSRKMTADILADIRWGDRAWIEMLHGPVLPLLSDALRSCFIAGPGKKLAVADYSQIEARVVAWIAGEESLVEAFRRGAKIYEEFAGFIFETDPNLIDKNDPRRQAGKIGVLGGGFGMGGKRAAEQYGIERALANKIIRTYRERYTSIVALWTNLNTSANKAVLEGGEVVVPDTNGRLRFEKRGGYLLLHLPSGRPLWYHAPIVRTYTVRREDVEIDPITGEERTVEIVFEATGVEISTLHGQTKQWVRQQMYGGLWTENAVQAIARDIMADAMLRCEEAAVPVILSVHDEIVAEVQPEFTAREFVNLLTTLPAWATDCPIAAEGWVEERYRK